MASISRIIQALVVEDFEPFRQLVCSMLGTRPEFQVIAEATDGIEAVRGAEQLRPDLILLDIGLPRLNGMAAARRIRNVSPQSKIIFVTQESDAEVVQEAFNLGAWGYVVKTQAGTDLLAAVDAVLEGRQFVSSTLPRQAATTQTLPVSAD